MAEKDRYSIKTLTITLTDPTKCYRCNMMAINRHFRGEHEPIPFSQRTDNEACEIRAGLKIDTSGALR